MKRLQKVSETEQQLGTKKKQNGHQIKLLYFYWDKVRITYDWQFDFSSRIHVDIEEGWINLQNNEMAVEFFITYVNHCVCITENFREYKLEANLWRILSTLRLSRLQFYCKNTHLQIKKWAPFKTSQEVCSNICNYICSNLIASIKLRYM